ncbi:DUF3953 domain-containing protein [Metabacillus arenae]|uniref:YczI family protein n=1 Tax=Metabacillus arenae TaxID=2771434 RepID=A0A926NH44_9BACI|nr:DUF3953 domain-containing protein [Metabacillus arenae]MBD1380458.1 YczI family protein [Metabacillus arenae]
MLKILRYILSVVVILFAAYGLIIQNFKYNHIMMFFLGLMMLVMGLEEFQKERKAYGWLFFVVFLFSLFVSIKGFLLN